MARAATSLVARLDEKLWFEHRLRPADFEILDLLTSAPHGRTLSELSQEISLSRSGTRLRARWLDAAGLVTLGVNPEPRGGVLVTLSDEGAAMHARLLETVHEVVVSSNASS